MFSKAALTFLVVGALSVNALTVPVARSPAPEPEPQELETWMLKRDLSYELFSRELQALDELFSREPEGWAEWAGFARSHYTAKREPSSYTSFSDLPAGSKVSPPITPPVTPPVTPPASPPASPPPSPRKQSTIRKDIWNHVTLF